MHCFKEKKCFCVRSFPYLQHHKVSGCSSSDGSIHLMQVSSRLSSLPATSGRDCSNTSADTDICMTEITANIDRVSADAESE